jgi:effector-binding domain-containing protein
MKTNIKPALNLTIELEIVVTKPLWFLYVEKTGPFMQTAPKAWEELRKVMPQLDSNQINGGLSLSRFDKSKKGDGALQLQAGFNMKGKPASIPAGLQFRELKGGKYARFLLTGPYSQLPEAYPRALSIVDQSPLKIRKDFCIEKYLNNPTTTLEAELLTEILIPIL